MRNFTLPFCSLLLAGVALAAPGAPQLSRVIPKPRPSHPGNIFLKGEQIRFFVPPAARWRIYDYDSKPLAEGEAALGEVRLASLDVGYYELESWTRTATNRVSFGVLAPLAAPTPLTSPICIDVAMAWFFPKGKMEDPASLCALAGINWVRDRLLWAELEPTRGAFAGHTRYDDSAAVQTAAGLQILQVNHLSPAWANPNGKRFPLDLRDAYRLHREMAKRWRHEVVAFEPWNEADVEVFGGHTGSEMASLQKAAYLGLKAGNPNGIACLNVFAIHRATTLKDFQQNEVWPYFDTFNLHHYETLNQYPELYADFRAVSAGKPLWVSECSVYVKWTGDEKLKELSREDLRLQAERVTKTYVLALHQGAATVFYFMLPHYSENQAQFGLLRSDLTPRPGYLALAAVGRLLADAKPLGRVPLQGGAGQAYFFRAKPDGKESDVVVAWSPPESSLELPATPRACFDHLGRPLPVTKTLQPGSAPIYAVLPKNTHPSLVPPPQPAALLAGKPSDVVLQALLPESDVLVKESGYKLETGTPKTVPIFVYNFRDSKLTGRLNASPPAGWNVTLPDTVTIEAGERKELQLNLNPPTTSWSDAVVKITGDFGSGGKPVLSLRFVRTTP